MRLLDHINDSPLWLTELATRNQSSTNTPTSDTGVLTGQFLGEGRRNSDFSKLAGFFKRHGYSAEDTQKMLILINQQQTSPLEEQELISIARSIERYPPTHIENITHKSLAQFLAQDLEDKCLYCTGHGFYTYTDNIWKRD